MSNKTFYIHVIVQIKAAKYSVKLMNIFKKYKITMLKICWNSTKWTCFLHFISCNYACRYCFERKNCTDSNDLIKCSRRQRSPYSSCINNKNIIVRQKLNYSRASQCSAHFATVIQDGTNWSYGIICVKKVSTAAENYALD